MANTYTKAVRAKPLEVLGSYTPTPNIGGAKVGACAACLYAGGGVFLTRALASQLLRVKMERVQYWLAVGAQPSERVATILAQ